MRQWRVGSFSMGLTLVAFGIVLFVSRAGAGWRVLSVVSRWWAVVPVLLGLEILAAGVFSKAANPPIRYDLFGVFTVFLVVCATIGLHGLTESGVLPAIQRAAGSMEYSVSLDGDTVRLDDSIRRIVVVSDSGEIEARTSPEPHVAFFGLGRIRAMSQEEASAMAALARPQTRSDGDTLFVSFGMLPEPGAFGGSPGQSRWTLIVPADRALEFSGQARASVVVSGLAADWIVKTAGSVSVRLGDQENLRLQARVTSEDRLSGAGILWKEVTAPVPAGEGTESVSPGPVIRDAVFGQGTYSLRVYSPGSVEIEI